MKSLKTLPLTMLGCLILSAGISFFIIPCNLVSGGATGIAQFLNMHTGVDLAAAVLLINLLTMAAGTLCLGRPYALRTIISSVAYPFFLRLLSVFHTASVIADHPIFATCLGAVLVGVGVGLVFVSGASTGGTDPIPLILNRYIKVPIGLAMGLTDVCIILLQAVDQSPLALIYGLLFVVVSSKTVDAVVNLSSKNAQASAVAG